MQNVLVTGAAGYLGRELVSQLMDKPLFDVYAFVNNKQMALQVLPNLNPEKIFDHTDRKSANIPFSNTDILVHCAFSRKSDGVELSRSLEFCRSFISEAIGKQVSRIINVSSQGVYGQSNPPLWHEKMQVAPTSLYALAKYASEQIIITLGNSSSDVYFTNLRIPGLTGGKSGLKPEVTSRFVSNVLKGQNIRIKGGKQVFSNMHVEDAASAIVALLSTDGKQWQNTYNIGNKWQHSIMEIAQMVLNIAPDFVSHNVKIQLEKADISLNSGMDSDRFRKFAKWEPQYDMKDIIRSLFNYLKDKSLTN